jgi:ribosomal-protein-alanine N-acetyltransferase
MNNIHLELLQEAHAREILSWRYPPPYDFYNPPEMRATADYVREFINPEYQFHAILDEDSRFIGFCSYGIDGQVPGGDYELEALDIGLGMKPALTGCGLGDLFLAAILNHAIKKFDPTIFRMTVANFNKRALRLYENFGFSKRGGFEDNMLNTSYTILIKQL